MYSFIDLYEAAQHYLRKWFNPVTCNPRQLRLMLMGALMTISCGELCVYNAIQTDIRAGKMPSHFNDTLFIVSAIVETVLGSLVSWWGYRCRRTVLIFWMTVVTTCFFSWFFLPNVNVMAQSEFCVDIIGSNNEAYSGLSWASGVRLTVFLISGMVFGLSRVGVWSHGLGYLEEYVPEQTALHYGTFLFGRVVPLLYGKRISTSVDLGLSLHRIIFLVGMVINLVQLQLFMPSKSPEVNGVLKTSPSMDDRGFSTSLSRVLNNHLVLGQIVAMGLTAASLWSYTFYSTDIIKVKYNLVPEQNTFINVIEFVPYIYLATTIALAGIKLSDSILPRFCNLKAITFASVMSGVATVLYVMLVVSPKCNTGKIAGLNSTYVHPECSLQCRCTPGWDEFSPICMVDDQTTYMSACQAGCSASELVHGISFYVNCTCGEGRAAAGACSDIDCSSALQLHDAIYRLLVTAILLALQAQGMLLLKMVDARDKSVVSGVACSGTALIVYIFSHSYFDYIKTGNCSWFEEGRCNLQNQVFPYLIGVSCATLAAISLVINITCLSFIKRFKRPNDDRSSSLDGSTNGQLTFSTGWGKRSEQDDQVSINFDDQIQIVPN